MTIENNEALNDSQETIDTQEVTATEEVQVITEEAGEQEVQETEKPIETPEQKVARLRRQLEREEKKLGITKPEVVKKPIPKQEQQNSLSQTDLYALMRNNVAEEDVQEVVDYAKLKRVSVSEALKSSIVKSIIQEKEEMRKTALATHTGVTKKGSAKTTDDQLVSKAQKGEIPESEEEIQRLYRIRKGMKN
jgi:hypothetical protein